MYLHVVYESGSTDTIDISHDSAWRQTKHLKYWRTQKSVIEAYLSFNKMPNPR
jgi:hypothetical protein